MNILKFCTLNDLNIGDIFIYSIFSDLNAGKIISIGKNSVKFYPIERKLFCFDFEKLNNLDFSNSKPKYLNNYRTVFFLKNE